MSTLKSRTRGRWLEIVVVFLTAVIAVNFAILIPTVVGQHSESRAGQNARDRQQKVYPVSVKAFTWIESKGGITPRDLDCIKYQRHCPPSPLPTPTP